MSNISIGKSKTFENIFQKLTMLCAGIIIVLMLALFAQLLWHSMPAIKKFGISFLYSTAWDPVRDEYGAAAAVYGTLVTTFIAIAIAVPLSFIIALYLVELAPPWLGVTMGHALDLLAAIPSIIYGMWGLFVLIPVMQNYVQPFMAGTVDLIIKAVSWLLSTCMGSVGQSIFEFLNDYIFVHFREIVGGNCTGSGFLTGGLILALMILPFICAVMRDVFKMVPQVVKEAAYGIGCTTTEVSWKITLRYGLQGMLGAVFLGLGRAVGETMALLYVIGNNPEVSKSLFAPGTTIAATLANNFQEAGGIFKSALFELGLILLLMTFLIQVVAQWWLNSVRKKSGAGL